MGVEFANVRLTCCVFVSRIEFRSSEAGANATDWSAAYNVANWTYSACG